ncbi:MAG: substrate-binding domain-containing protein [Candidatus Korobacteraceae bacterium]
MTRTVLLHSLLTLSLSLLLVVPSMAGAAELKVFCTHALTPALEQLKADFESKTGNKLVIIDSTSIAAAKRIQAGEAGDVAILTDSVNKDLVKQGKLDPKSVKDIAVTGISVAVKAGAPKPDISTVEAFKKTLLAAKSIAYSDPAAGGYSGIVAARGIQRLGLTDQLKSKTTMVGGGGAVGPLAADGRVELAIQMESELKATKGVDIVGPLPGDLQDLTLFSAAVMTGSKNAAGAEKLIKLFKSKKAIPVLKATGMQMPK